MREEFQMSMRSAGDGLALHQRMWTAYPDSLRKVFANGQNQRSRLQAYHKILRKFFGNYEATSGGDRKLEKIRGRRRLHQRRKRAERGSCIGNATPPLRSLWPEKVISFRRWRQAAPQRQRFRLRHPTHRFPDGNRGLRRAGCVADSRVCGSRPGPASRHCPARCL